ncbi:MAG: flagellar basal body-associated FliL family protein [Bryocella sp.]
MATADTSLPSSPAMPAVKIPFMTLLVCCLVAAVFAVGGAAASVVYLARHGELAVGSSTAAVPAKTKVLGTHPKALDSMLINLADDGGHAYLRLGVVLAEEDDPQEKKVEAKPVPGADAAVRDTIFDVLGREKSDELLAPDGKDKLKSALLAVLNSREPELKVRAIYFTDFLVQR